MYTVIYCKTIKEKNALKRKTKKYFSPLDCFFTVLRRHRHTSVVVVVIVVVVVSIIIGVAGCGGRCGRCCDCDTDVDVQHCHETEHLKNELII